MLCFRAHPNNIILEKSNLPRTCRIFFRVIYYLNILRGLRFVNFSFKVKARVYLRLMVMRKITIKGHAFWKRLYGCDQELWLREDGLLLE